MCRLLLIALALVLTSCKSGIGDPSGSATHGVGVVLGDYLLVDLANGRSEPRATVPDLLTNPRYRDGVMVFRRLANGTAVLGSPAAQRWAQGDESETTAAVATTYIAVFETTRAQWSRISGNDPAAAVEPAALAGSGNDAPVCGLSLSAIQSALQTTIALRGRLSLPSATLWERSARAGTTSSYAWGEARDLATVSRYAVVSQNATNVGPQAVGTREANSWGLFDTSGNVWEWTADGELRGGSWSDGLPLARPANRIVADQNTPHALAGMRLVYAP